MTATRTGAVGPGDGRTGAPRPGDIELAAKRTERLVRRTPSMTVDGSELGVAGTLSLKLELVQHSGSFKARGAANFLLSNRIGDAGVVAASGGNHGAAVAWAAHTLGHPATIFIPTITAEAKVERLRSYGAEIHQIGDVYADALEASRAFEAESGATPVHAYEDPVVVAGAGTTGREFAEQVGAMDTVLVACGGGGLSGGIAAWFGKSRTRVVACETEGTACFAAALEAGEPVDVAVSGLAADALGATRIGQLAWDCLRASDAGNVVVTDDEVTDAGRYLWDQYRLMTEPSAVVPVAALLSGRYRPERNEHVGLVICGANTTL
ncbi:MAG: threonine/serine dehydratase [Acidimicrobiia bacterium]|nr:threonine/serine dehydratase [Acidimicrobiia bacterium]